MSNKFSINEFKKFLKNWPNENIYGYSKDTIKRCIRASDRILPFVDSKDEDDLRNIAPDAIYKCWEEKNMKKAKSTRDNYKSRFSKAITDFIERQEKLSDTTESTQNGLTITIKQQDGKIEIDGENYNNLTIEDAEDIGNIVGSYLKCMIRSSQPSPDKS